MPVAVCQKHREQQSHLNRRSEEAGGTLKADGSLLHRERRHREGMGHGRKDTWVEGKVTGEEGER